jgi:toxin CptA
MHNAPSVSYPVGRCAFQRWLYVCFTLLASAVLWAWALNQETGLFGYFAACAAALGVALGWRSLQHQATLTWDGHVWCLHGANTAREDALGQVHVALDAQKALLLRWQPTSDTRQSKPVWLWLGAEQSHSHWLSLRRAVYQRANIH